MKVIEVSMEQRWNGRVEDTGDPRANPPTSDIGRHDSHLRICSSMWDVLQKSRPVLYKGEASFKTDRVFYLVDAWLDYSPPAMANQDRFPDFLMWESCWTTPLVSEFSWGAPFSPRPCIPAPIHTHLASTLIGSQDLDVDSNPNLFNHSLPREDHYLLVVPLGNLLNKVSKGGKVPGVPYASVLEGVSASQAELESWAVTMVVLDGGPVDSLTGIGATTLRALCAQAGLLWEETVIPDFPERGGQNEDGCILTGFENLCLCANHSVPEPRSNATWFAASRSQQESELRRDSVDLLGGGKITGLTSWPRPFSSSSPLRKMISRDALPSPPPPPPGAGFVTAAGGGLPPDDRRRGKLPPPAASHSCTPLAGSTRRRVRRQEARHTPEHMQQARMISRSLVRRDCITDVTEMLVKQVESWSKRPLQAIPATSYAASHMEDTVTERVNNEVGRDDNGEMSVVVASFHIAGCDRRVSEVAANEQASSARVCKGLWNLTQCHLITRTIRKRIYFVFHIALETLTTPIQVKERDRKTCKAPTTGNWQVVRPIYSHPPSSSYHPRPIVSFPGEKWPGIGRAPKS
ncbi:hypothetical protein PR048_003848 [Dryococelus australis]|uniref:Uncharacterized protein n=1 Tax=Dryococelus australis TaxID=614101 RepID=A0ABQ9IP64_9NEOP|nr:hypothetical protein PR048_003848 [Dryococelus australis]